MEIANVVRCNRELTLPERCVTGFLNRNDGKYNRAALLGAYSSHHPVRDNEGMHLPNAQLHEALEGLLDKRLIGINGEMDVVLNRDELLIFTELAENLEQYMELIKAAVDAQKNSWSPYSHFKVGAAILTTEGKIVAGTNFENASYGVTICAERGAIGAAVKDGVLNPSQGKYIKAVAAVLPTQDFGRPCGACRQAIYEFSIPGGEALVVMANPHGQAEVVKIKNLLPYAFGPFDLGVLMKETARQKNLQKI